MAAGVTIWIPPGGRRGSTFVVLDPLEDVREALDPLEPEAEPDSDSPVVAEALSSVDDSADPESVVSGASVIVPVADSDSAEEGSAVSDDSGGDDVSVGASEKLENQHFPQTNHQSLIEPTTCRVFLSSHDQSLGISRRVWPWPCSSKINDEEQGE